ncbi:uncharacterized protein PHALS_03590 [Plasmopara halstedii]|uniref:Uncharacterized protein n=1 Tax=Plasmopara halstedii TaxID=4781 RepID=A0A0P1B0R8_PLAHL|nr:uncharacterized protein PHALS_03590 [Plasmopara halstedii]CEG46920.1 hypothetical protein PHALS_03590 [Plasmopara halstedii]|eukprot:XP_024583289.1 hypothetical protein PHALS_03590 [Plasmopara halstedii]
MLLMSHTRGCDAQYKDHPDRQISHFPTCRALQALSASVSPYKPYRVHLLYCGLPVKQISGFYPEYGSHQDLLIVLHLFKDAVGTNANVKDHQLRGMIGALMAEEL